MKIERILEAESYDVRAYKPSTFAKLIMFWCFRNTDVPNSRRWHHCSGRLKILWEDGTITNKSYDAQLKYQRTDFSDYIKKYQIINYCNTIETFNLSQNDLFAVYLNYESMVGKDYGTDSIIGIVASAIWKGVKFGVNGSKRIICSEGEILAYLPFLKIPDPLPEPFDFYDPWERGTLFAMKAYGTSSNYLKNFLASRGK